LFVGVVVGLGDIGGPAGEVLAIEKGDRFGECGHGEEGKQDDGFHAWMVLRDPS
jgi:hypothetical protein